MYFRTTSEWGCSVESTPYWASLKYWVSFFSSSISCSERIFTFGHWFEPKKSHWCKQWWMIYKFHLGSIYAWTSQSHLMWLLISLGLSQSPCFFFNCPNLLLVPFSSSFAFFHVNCLWFHFVGSLAITLLLHWLL